MLNNSQSILDLQVPPSNRLEKLKGNLKDFYSIKINDQCRIVFKWQNGNIESAELFFPETGNGTDLSLVIAIDTSQENILVGGSQF